MADYAPITYTGNGSQTAYNISFGDYLKQGNLTITVNGVTSTNGGVGSYDYSIDDALKKVNFNTAPATGVPISITRSTPTDLANNEVNFTAGGGFNEEDMDDVVKQSLLIDQEVKHQISTLQTAFNEASIDLAFNSYSDLTTNLTTVTNRQIVQLKGYYTAYDGGGGLFITDTASSESADGLEILVDANGVRYKRTLPTFVNARLMGAKLDGVTDDATAINNLLATGKNVLLDEGDILIGTSLTFISESQQIIGAGGGKTRLWKNANVPVVIFPSSKSRTQLKGCWVIGAHTGFGNSVYDITAWTTIPSGRVSFTDTTDNIQVGDDPGATLGPADALLEDCRTFNAGRDGINHQEGPRLTLRKVAGYYNARWGYWSDYQSNVQGSGTALDTNHTAFDTSEFLNNGLGNYTEGGNCSVGGAHNVGINLKIMRSYGEGFRNKSRKSYYQIHEELNGRNNSHITAWAATTAYAVGDVKLTTANRLYLCTVAGTSSGSEPTHTSGTAADGSVTWQFRSSSPFYGEDVTDKDVKVFWLANNGDKDFENGTAPYDLGYCFECASTGQNNNYSHNEVVTSNFEISRRAQRSMPQYGVSSSDSFKNLRIRPSTTAMNDFELSAASGSTEVYRVLHDEATNNNYLQYIAGSNNRFWWSQLVYGLRPQTTLQSANWSNFNTPIGKDNYIMFDVSGGNLVADLYNNTLLGSSDDDARGLLKTFHRVNGTNQLRIRTTDGNSPPDKKILGLDGTVYTSGATAGYDLNATNNVVATTLMYVGSDNPITTSIDADIRWVEIAQLRGPQAAEADLNQTISGSYTQAEVQAISDKVDALLQKLRDHGTLA